MGQWGDLKEERKRNVLPFSDLFLFSFPIFPCLRMCQIPLCLFLCPLPDLISLQSFGFKHARIYMQLNAGFDFSPGKLEG